jgi:ubiquinone/menaquinone biosynthesis C-methylase UbiE
MENKDILQEVKRTYSAIAHEFDATRDRLWPEFKAFLKEIEKRFIYKKRLAALDVGCGNGRLSHFLKNYPLNYVGVDNNRTMLRIAKKKNPNAIFKYAEITKLPFPSHSFDTVWCIAVLHHLPTKKLRLQALREIKRVLKPDGLLCLTVWNLWQPKYRKYINQKTHNAAIPWKEKILRYYYAFKQNEFRDLLKNAGLNKMKQLKSMHNFAFVATNRSQL